MFVAPITPGGDELDAEDAGMGPGFIRQSRHPHAAFFHLFFKSLALLVYMFSGMFTSNFIFVCVICILLLAFDFWTVKNVTGRLLVGLRWWNYVKEDGSNEWVFESLENMSEVRCPVAGYLSDRGNWLNHKTVGQQQGPSFGTHLF